MTLDDLINEFRIMVDDRARPYLVDDDWVVTVMNEAVVEASERALLIHDDTTASVCETTVTLAVPDYTLDNSVIIVREARLDSTGKPITQVTMPTLRREAGSSWRVIEGTPRKFLRTQQAIRLYPIPVVNDTIYWDVYRRPIASEVMDILQRQTVTPPIAFQHHRSLLHWAAYRYYLIRDAEITLKSDDADRHLAIFERLFGSRPSAAMERIRTDMPPYAQNLPRTGAI